MPQPSANRNPKAPGLRELTISKCSFEIQDPELDGVTHSGSTISFRFNEVPAGEHTPSVVNNINSGNVNKTRLQNVANQNVQLHLHYTEICSTPKDGGEPIRTEMVGYNLASTNVNGNAQRLQSPIDDASSHAIATSKSPKKRERWKKLFKSLLGTPHTNATNDRIVNKAVQRDQATSEAETEYFTASEIPPLVGLPSQTTQSTSLRFVSGPHERGSSRALPWSETVDDFVKSITTLSRSAAGMASPDIHTNTRVVPLSTESSASSPPTILYSHDIANLIQGAVSEAVQQQFAALQMTSNALLGTHTPRHSPSHSSAGEKGGAPKHILCDSRRVTARLHGDNDPSRPSLNGRIPQKLVISAEPSSATHTIEVERKLSPRRQVKRPNALLRQSSADGYDADGDDSDGACGTI